MRLHPMAFPAWQIPPKRNENRINPPARRAHQLREETALSD